MVTGATGLIGNLIARGLASEGHMVRAMVRNPAAATSLKTAVSDLAVADLNSPPPCRTQSKASRP